MISGASDVNGPHRKKNFNRKRTVITAAAEDSLRSSVETDPLFKKRDRHARVKSDITKQVEVYVNNVQAPAQRSGGDELKQLHRLCFGRPGEKTKIKKMLGWENTMDQVWKILMHSFNALSR